MFEMSWDDMKKSSMNEDSEDVEEFGRMWKNQTVRLGSRDKSHDTHLALTCSELTPSN